MMTETTQNSIKKESRKRFDETIQSGPNRIVIQTREQSYTFEKGTYREEYLSPYLKEKEYEDIIAKASRIMGDSWAKKRKNDEIKLPIWVTVLSALAVVLIIIYTVLLYLSPTSSNGTAMIVGSIICVSVASIIIFALSIYNFCRKIGTFKPLEEIIKEDLDLYFSEINQRFNENIEFKYNTNKRWIVCNIKKVAKTDKVEKEDRKKFIPEEVEEDPEKENANEEDELKRATKKNSRAQSIAAIPKLHTKSLSISKNILHSRGQSHVVNRIEELELANIEY